MAKDDFTAFLGPGTDFQGQLNFTGIVRVDCRFVGNIKSDGKLILAKDANVEGTVTVGELVVHGALNGEIIVTKRTILHQGARVTGTLTTQTLVMEDGALLQGELHMGKDAKKGKNAVGAHHLNSQTEHNVPLIDATVKQ
ncbi:polymer-forming cytoskeletal protein [Desulfovibrio sp. OttesenSCG-928-A18]|nr:polymer-forming cytoskeletal protein [Desulfovibrio sp. OttesenSCG-928-A18]